MKPFKKKFAGGDRGGNKSGGFSRGWFGGRSGGSFNRDGAPQLHSAVCADCGNQCQVPFKPNGRKPIYCSSCFKNHGDEQGDRFEKRSFDAPRFAEKRSFERPAQNPNLERQMEEIQSKLDQILQTLEEMNEEKE